MKHTLAIFICDIQRSRKPWTSNQLSTFYEERIFLFKIYPENKNFVDSNKLEHLITSIILWISMLMMQEGENFLVLRFMTTHKHTQEQLALHKVHKCFNEWLLNNQIKKISYVDGDCKPLDGDFPLWPVMDWSTILIWTRSACTYQYPYQRGETLI